MGIGLSEGLLLLCLVLLLFGAKKLPQLGRSIGQSLTEFKKGLSEEENTKSKEDEKRPS
jgi:sec-independent protein translocase protein TatA